LTAARHPTRTARCAALGEVRVIALSPYRSLRRAMRGTGYST
jgi:hypothetical protein